MALTWWFPNDSTGVFIGMFTVYLHFKDFFPSVVLSIVASSTLMVNMFRAGLITDYCHNTQGSCPHGWMDSLNIIGSRVHGSTTGSCWPTGLVFIHTGTTDKVQTVVLAFIFFLGFLILILYFVLLCHLLQNITLTLNCVCHTHTDSADYWGLFCQRIDTLTTQAALGPAHHKTKMPGSPN